MALISPSDVTFTLVPETTAGVTPTASATRYEIPAKADQTLPSFTANEIASNTKRPGRAGNGMRRGMISGTGTLDMRLQAAPVVNTLMESAVSGKFTTTGTKTLKSGTQDSTFSVISLLQSGAAGSALVDVAAGAMANKMTVSAKAGDEVNVSFDLLATVNSQLTTDNALTVTAVPAAAYEFAGAEVSAITVAGNSTIQFTELSLEVTQERNVRGKLGTNTPIGIGTNGTRTVKLTLKAYRESFAIDALLTGQAQSFSFTVGATGNGYGFFIPAGYASIPTTEFDAESAFVNIEVTAAYDVTSATDFYVTQL
jgi:hypothetical protein